MGSFARAIRWIVPVVAGIVVLSCARARARAPQPVVIGRAQAPARVATGPRMNHAAHLEKGLECADCHMKDRKEGEKFEPKKLSYAVCAECHDDEDEKLPEEKKIKNLFFTPAGEPRWSKAIQSYDAEILFRHGPHATDSASCAPCHGDMKGPARFTGLRFDMGACMSCHQQKGAKNSCETCHRDLRTNVPPPNHMERWREVHGQLAGSPQARAEQHCDLCHTEPQYCDRCHQNTPPRSHTNGLWKEVHGQVARSSRERAEQHCDMCHDDRQFCDRCHRDEMPRSHNNLWRVKTHGVMAAMDRASCMTCHTTDYCVRCHEETPPMSHRGRWASPPSVHCGECHFPIGREESCRVCHQDNPTHDTAADQPAWHTPGMNCRLCHLPGGVGPGGAPPVPHFDNGMECSFCHK